jgi:dethiobiotin synthetase
LSPHLASKRAGIKIDIAKILSDYNKLAEIYDYILIEGAGGITCPVIDDKYLMWNLIKDINTGVIVVSDSGLGSINYALTTLEYIKNRDIEIRGLVFNNYINNDFMHEDNVQMVEKMSGVSVVSCVGKDDENINIDKENLLALFE